MKENEYQANLIKKLKDRFPGSIILKNDPNYKQGIPDLSIFYKDKWATLEVKKDEKAKLRPNQEYYVETMNEMSFSRIIFPQNEEEVLDALEQSFKGRTKRKSRSSRSK